MFVDASAIVAILTREDDAAELARTLDRAQRPITSAIAVFEASAALARKKSLAPARARDDVARFLRLAGVVLVPIGEQESAFALNAMERFGKGRHSAKLNMGDCFAYACARARNVPLLFKGDDFG